MIKSSQFNKKSQKNSKKTQKNAKKCSFLNIFTNFTVIDKKTTFIEKGAKIGDGTIIYPNCYIDKNCKIGKQNTIYSGCFLQGCVSKDNCQIGPFAHTRENTFLGNNVRLGNFCETKNCIIGDFTKVAHLTYIGDAEIGKNCNFGCGVIFANYNGKIKQKTTIGDKCFIGCNVNLIAPLNIGKNCFIGAGTTISKNLKSNTFALGRASLITKEKKEKI